MKIPANIIEHMARAAYANYRRRAPSLPDWEQTTEYWKGAAYREMEAALQAALDAGLVRLVP